MHDVTTHIQNATALGLAVIAVVAMLGKAVQSLRRARHALRGEVRVSPGHRRLARVYNDAGVAANRKGMRRAAERAFRAALMLDPYFEEAERNLRDLLQRGS